MLVLAGFALRLPLFDRFPFREDEAIYSYWALHGWYEDPLFLQVWPDKPPIFIWLLSVAFQLWGVTPAAARFVSIVASALSIPIVAATARRWWGDSAGLIAAAFLAFNPFAISFAPTAYTDSTLLLMGALAVCCVAYRRFFFAGLWLALAIMTKQQGLLLAPLVVAVAWPDFRRRGSSSSPQDRVTNGQATTQKIRPVFTALIQFLAGMLLIVAPILCWDSLRWSVAPSPWDLGSQNIGGIGLAEPQAWLPRLFDWSPLASYLLGSPLVWILWSLLVAGAVFAALLSPRKGIPLRVQLLGGWLVCFALLHIVATVPIWDRYLLPLVLPLALIAGWAGSQWVENLRTDPASQTTAGLAIGRDLGGLWSRRLATVIMAGILVLVAFPITLRAASGQLPVGADHGAYVGLDEALDRVRDQADYRDNRLPSDPRLAESILSLYAGARGQDRIALVSKCSLSGRQRAQNAPPTKATGGSQLVA